MAGEILKTNDYYMFKRLKGNRAVSDKRVDDLVESIKEIGWISQPILVNENMEIIDGQGRFEALKRLGMPIEYRVLRGGNIKCCMVMNEHNTEWERNDFIESYAEQGIKSYERLNMMMKRFEVPAEVVHRAMGKSISRSRLKSGDFEMTDYEYGHALKLLPKYKRFRQAMNRFGGAGRLKNCVIFFLIEGQYPHDEILKVLTTCDPALIYTSSVERFLETIEDAYNKNKRAENKLYFLEDYRRNGNGK